MITRDTDQRSGVALTATLRYAGTVDCVKAPPAAAKARQREYLMAGTGNRIQWARVLLGTHKRNEDVATPIYTRACTSSKDNGEATLKTRSNVYFSAM
jgi:hypothetical protein